MTRSDSKLHRHLSPSYNLHPILFFLKRDLPRALPSTVLLTTISGDEEEVKAPLAGSEAPPPAKRRHLATTAPKKVCVGIPSALSILIYVFPLFPHCNFLHLSSIFFRETYIFIHFLFSLLPFFNLPIFLFFLLFSSFILQMFANANSKCFCVTFEENLPPRFLPIYTRHTFC